MDSGKKKQAIRITAAAIVSALGIVGFALFAMAHGHDHGPPQKDMTVDQTIRHEVIEGIIANLNRYYVFPDMAKAAEKQLRARVASGEFDSIDSADKLADRLTDDLRHDLNDKHLDVRYFAETLSQSPDNGDDSPEQKAEELLHSQRFNFGFESVGRLHGDLGYIDLHFFARPQHVAERLAATMTLLADTKALIIDLRKCSGGDPETVMLFASYLYDQPTHLNDVYWRDENRTEARWTTATVPGKRYGEARRVYLLTGEDTFSGCEDFAYALKNNRRATLVGQTTGGGAHGGAPHRLDAHFMVFVPSGRPINPLTHTDWEGVGIEPNIKASEKKALDVAQIAVLEELVANERDPDWRQRLQQAMTKLR